MSQVKEQREAWKIAADLKSECYDKISRMRKAQYVLEGRAKKIEQSADELHWITRTADKVQKASTSIEYIEAERDHFRECAADTEGLSSPAYLFTALADLCDAILAEKASACR